MAYPLQFNQPRIQNHPFHQTIIFKPTRGVSSTSELDLRLRDGEKMKFACRTGGTNKITKRTLSADEVIGEIMNANFSFIPIAIGAFGEICSTFLQFSGGTNPMALPNFPED
jgi:hypothetical protein